MSYEYNLAGHCTKMGGSFARTLLPQALTSTTYNDGNRLTQRGSLTLTYDDNGNLTSDGTNTYTWNARNQLQAISGTVSATFQYDAFGRRTHKTINNQTTSYLYDGANVVQERVGAASTNLLNGGLGEVFTRTDSTGTWSPLRDGLGSTLALSDSTGTVQTQYSYEAFGQTSSTGAASSNTSQYTGRENDGTGLQYNRARYYSPTLQRFISEDPVGMAGGINLYAYVSNNPISYSDPLGTDKGDGGMWLLGPSAHLAAGFGDNLGSALVPLPLKLLCPECNPVKALRDMTPGGGAVNPDSGWYKGGEWAGRAWQAAFGGAAAAAAGSGAAAADAGVPQSLEYAPRVFTRMAEDPGLFHNFPKLLDNEILHYGQKTIISDNYVLYTLEGTLQRNAGRLASEAGTIYRGVYEIGVDPATWTIVHRFFNPF